LARRGSNLQTLGKLAAESAKPAISTLAYAKFSAERSRRSQNQGIFTMWGSAPEGFPRPDAQSCNICEIRDIDA
jgi:hypothetical protein